MSDTEKAENVNETVETPAEDTEGHISVRKHHRYDLARDDTDGDDTEGHRRLPR